MAAGCRGFDWLLGLLDGGRRLGGRLLEGGLVRGGLVQFGLGGVEVLLSGFGRGLLGSDLLVHLGLLGGHPFRRGFVGRRFVGRGFGGGGLRRQVLVGRLLGGLSLLLRGGGVGQSIRRLLRRGGLLSGRFRRFDAFRLGLFGGLLRRRLSVRPGLGAASAAALAAAVFSSNIFAASAAA